MTRLSTTSEGLKGVQWHKGSLGLILVFFCLLVVNSAWGVEKINFDIPQSKAGQALNLFARQADIQLLYPYDVIKTISVEGLVGEYSVEEGLNRLLRDTCLKADFGNEKQTSANVDKGEIAIVTKNCVSRKTLLARLCSGGLTSLLLGFACNGEDVMAQATMVSEGGTAKLEEIVVTARKRTETLEDVPVSVNVLSKNMIESLRVDGVENLAAQVPGLHAAQTNGSAGGNVTLRGVGSAEQSSVIEQAVSIHVDGIPVNDARMLNAALLDLEQIEVMRGPQALFFGKNSPGGVISVHTADPTDELEIKATAAYETEAEEKIGRLIVSGPLTDSLKGRLAMSYSDQDGNFDLRGVDQVVSVAGVPTTFPLSHDHYPSNEDKFIMGTLLYEPSENFSAKLKYSHFERQLVGSHFRSGQRVYCPYGSPQAITPIDDCQKDDVIYGGGVNQVAVAASELNPSRNPDGFIETKIDLAALELNYAMPDSGLTLTSVGGYYKSEQPWIGDASYEPASKLISAAHPEVEQFSQEIRLISDWDSALNFTSGLYYEHKESTYDGDTFLGPIIGLSLLGQAVPVPLGRDHFSQDDDSWSAFLALSWDVTETINLSGGARYSEETKKFDREWNHVPVIQDKDEETWENVSPELTLSYRPTEDVMLFIGYREGFKSGGFDGAYNPALAGGGIWDFIYDEESVTGFEGGAKTSWLDGSMRVNLTLFSYKYEDMQLGTFDPETTGLKIYNAAESNIEGVELEGIWATPVDGLTLRGNLNYLDATFEDSLADCYTGQTIALGCNRVLVNGAFVKQDFDGESLPFSPEWEGALGFDYEVFLTEDWRLATSFYATYRGSYETSSENIPHSQQESYWVTNASVSLFSPGDRWEFYVQGINLSDEYWLGRTVNTPLTGRGKGTTTATLSDVSGVVAGGRRITLGITYRL